MLGAQHFLFINDIIDFLVESHKVAVCLAITSLQSLLQILHFELFLLRGESIDSIRDWLVSVNDLAWGTVLLNVGQL